MKKKAKSNRVIKELAPVLLGAGAGVSGVLFYGNLCAPDEERSTSFTAVTATTTGILGATAVFLACRNAKSKTTTTDASEQACCCNPPCCACGK